MTLSDHGLCKHINYLKIKGNMRKRNNRSVQCLPNRMALHLNMLCSLMINGISGNLNGTIVINMKRSQIRLRKTKVNQKPMKPDNL